MVAEAVTGLSLVVWVYLAFGHGRFWRPPTLPEVAGPAGDGSLGSWPSVVAIVPARDEADVLPGTLPTLVGQDYPGSFHVVLVDDDSGDGTGDLAARLGAAVVRSSGPPPGWSGKVAAMATGVEHAGEPDFLLFTDADIRWAPGALTALVRAALAHRLDLVSQMVRLRAASAWERATIPAFVYFFAQLYPFARVNRAGRTAAAAGGCMLVRRATLVRAGGLGRIRGARIDDVALARVIKEHGRIWLGVTRAATSVRPYRQLSQVWDMVARSAYVQLRYSPALLALTSAGLLLVYAVPPVAAFSGWVLHREVLGLLGLLAWTVMTATYLPLLRFHGVSRGWSPLLPAVALLYLAMTLDSARRHAAGRGGAWKGRVA